MGDNKAAGIAGFAVTLFCCIMFINTHYGSGSLTGADGHKIYIENSGSKDVSLNEVEAFIAFDNTYETPYQPGKFECTDYAEQVQHNANKMHIACGIATIEFTSGPGHAVNVFQTTDHGIIYIDCTGTKAYTYSITPGEQYAPQIMDCQGNGTLPSMGIVKSVNVYLD